MRKGKLRRMLVNSVPLETERLILRRIEPRDDKDMFDYASRPEVTEYLLWMPHVNIEATRGYIEFIQTRYKKGLYADWALELKENRKMIGTCGYANIDSSALRCEIGYVLSPEYRKKGYMTEAINAILDLTFSKLFFESAELRIMDENADSARLAERVGFRLDRVIKDELTVKDVPRTIRHYVMTAPQYFLLRAGKTNI